MVEPDSKTIEVLVSVRLWFHKHLPNSSVRCAELVCAAEELHITVKALKKIKNKNTLLLPSKAIERQEMSELKLPEWS